MTIKIKERYKGHIIKQVKGITERFDIFFNDEKFDNIIEIGSGTGAFSLYFAMKAKKMNAKFITCDLKTLSKKIQKDLNVFGAIIMTGDVNENTKIVKIARDSGRCLILNDGGLKLPQFHRFSKIIKTNDIILTHDYYKDRCKSGKGIIIMKDVLSCIKSNKLKLINEELFDKYLWLCVRKI